MARDSLHFNMKNTTFVRLFEERLVSMEVLKGKGGHEV